jgi:hypothetical protein
LLRNTRSIFRSHPPTAVTGERAMGREEDRFRRIEPLWCDLDEALIVAFQSLDPIGQWPWLSSNPKVQAIWNALTQPENLAELESWLAHFNGGLSMNDWAAVVTHKAIEVSRSRANGSE